MISLYVYEVTTTEYEFMNHVAGAVNLQVSDTPGGHSIVGSFSVSVSPVAIGARA